MRPAWAAGIAAATFGLLGMGAAPRSAAQCSGVIALGGVSSASGSAFKAEVRTTSTGESGPASTVLVPRTELVARDSQGRLRMDRDLGPYKVQGEGGQETEIERHLISICNPVSGERIVLDTLEKTATVQKPLGTPGRQLATRAAAGPNFCARQLHLGANFPNVQREDLGHKTIEGFDAQGVLERRTMPNMVNGVEGSSTSETQVWCSEELGAVVLRVMGSSTGQFTRQIAMTNIQRAEPDASLFVVPADYKIVERVLKERTSTGSAPVDGIRVMTPSEPEANSEKPQK
jgi:hypothetical protein